MGISSVAYNMAYNPAFYEEDEEVQPLVQGNEQRVVQGEKKVMEDQGVVLMTTTRGEEHENVGKSSLFVSSSVQVQATHSADTLSATSYNTQSL